MSKRKTDTSTGTMLDLWRPPKGAGDPIGCLATTYTFAPGLFDEQCLGRFLDIESEPNREDLAFLLERESRLGGVYAGVLVDHTQAGVEHSLRWDVLPVRIPNAKQHAKITLLAWSRHIRIIVASANISEPGYRTNYEAAAVVDLAPDGINNDILTQAISFLRSLLLFVPGASERTPEIQRVEEFLNQIERQVEGWKPNQRSGPVRQRLVFTLPATPEGEGAASSLEQTIEACRGRGGSPSEAWVASPFFDSDSDTSRLTASLCKLMARGEKRKLCFCVPEIQDDEATKPRLAAPKALILTPPAYQGSVKIKILPRKDSDKNPRLWHAKMLALRTEQYSALMIGSSNFTSAGMGVGQIRNTEANLLTIVDRENYIKEVRQLEAVWPDMEEVADPESAEWLGAQTDKNEEEHAMTSPLPRGFLSATYRAGDERKIVLRLDAGHLPDSWYIRTPGQDQRGILSNLEWETLGRPLIVEIAWTPIQPPEKLLVQWPDHEAFMPINVEDSRLLPPPAQIEHMSADDMLLILAVADPSAAFRAWSKTQRQSELFDPDLDSAIPIDLDPLRRYDLHGTFLHRIRRRARILAQLRLNLQRPVWGVQALEWRLRGLIGIEPLAGRLMREFVNSSNTSDEALLTLADFLIVLREVDYQPGDGSLSKKEFEKIFRDFLKDLTNKLVQQVEAHRYRVSEDLFHFWERVVERCRE